MSNIFICGYGEKADALKGIIDKLMHRVGLQDDAITSIVDMKAESCDGRRMPMPYLRICSTDEADIPKIINIFKEGKVKEDVEWLVMDGFIQASKMG
jgi:hypothetical protein